MLLEGEQAHIAAASSSNVMGPSSQTKTASSGNQGALGKRYQIFGLANPRSGDGLASGFLTDYPPVNEKAVYFEQMRSTV